MARSGAEVRTLACRAVHERSHARRCRGGDGTVDTVAAALVGTEVALGVLPLGTLNHFAKDLGLPLELGGAVQTIGAGYTVRIDVGDVNGQMFLNNSSLGLYPRIVRHRQKQTERLGRSKWRVSLWATLVFLSPLPAVDHSVCVWTTLDLVRPYPLCLHWQQRIPVDPCSMSARGGV